MMNACYYGLGYGFGGLLGGFIYKYLGGIWMFRIIGIITTSSAIAYYIGAEDDDDNCL
jgi:hypothetical protein